MILDYLKENMLIESEAGYFYHGSKKEFDNFDINQIKSGDGLNKYGAGIYFTDSKELAEYYSNNNYMYKVKLYNVDSYHEWEDDISDIYELVIRGLNRLGLDSNADEIRQDYEDYGDYWQFSQLYDWLSTVLGSELKSSSFLNKIGVAGVKAKDLHDRGEIYVAFSTDNIKMIDSWHMGEEE